MLPEFQEVAGLEVSGKPFQIGFIPGQRFRACAFVGAHEKHELADVEVIGICSDDTQNVTHDSFLPGIEIPGQGPMC
ncbi:hypothetical protein D478_21608 [Brevibacillus agri BAB-2500]|nr:hypothetical protein D478_21608 [Brevibacillus agri BAB-2500]